MILSDLITRRVRNRSFALGQTSPQIIFIVITAFGSNQSFVEALEVGAANYVLKPLTMTS